MTGNRLRAIFLVPGSIRGPKTRMQRFCDAKIVKLQGNVNFSLSDDQISGTRRFLVAGNTLRAIFLMPGSTLGPKT